MTILFSPNIENQNRGEKVEKEEETSLMADYITAEYRYLKEPVFRNFSKPLVDK